MSVQSTAAAQPATAQQPVTDQFEFDDAFQLKIAALSLRDSEFLRRSAMMLKPEFFVNEGLGQLVAVALDHFQKYNCAPDNASLIAQLKER
ncbi:TPA: DNA helicase, partial [Acinetobacter baumannii]|nr:DNA helicase [Acinetobacter baumannii]